jgi:LPXTG-motif cell wall-anchored protein
MLAMTGSDIPVLPALLAAMMLLIGAGLLRRHVSG